MARGYSQSRSELPSGIEASNKDIRRYASDVDEIAFRKIPKGTEYLPNMGAVGVDTTDMVAIESAKDFQDYFKEWVTNSSPRDTGLDDNPAVIAFKKQYEEAIDGAFESGLEFGVGGIDSAGGGGYPTERFTGQGNSGIFKTVLKAKGAPDVEMSWDISVERDDEARGGFDYTFNVKGMKILT